MISGAKYWIALGMLAGGFVAACNQQREQCLTPTIASLSIESMHVISDTGTIFYDTLLPAAEFVPLAAVNAGAITDSLLFVTTADFTISLSPGKANHPDSCRWLFRADTTGILPQDYTFDTFLFVYTPYLQFISNACGYTDFYNLDTVITTHFNVDSVHITNTSVTNDASTRQLQIYIHPDF